MPILIEPYSDVNANSGISSYARKLPFPTLSPTDPTGGQSLGNVPSAMDPINLRSLIQNDGYDYGRYAHDNP
jgi:hypothetical protein